MSSHMTDVEIYEILLEKFGNANFFGDYYGFLDWYDREYLPSFALTPREVVKQLGIESLLGFIDCINDGGFA